MDVLAIERSDEGLVEFCNDCVSGFITFMLNGLHLADSHGQIPRVGQDGAQQLGSIGEIAREFSEKVKKLGIAGD